MERKESIGNDATSKETLKDIEDKELPPVDQTDDIKVPSPDGELDEPGELKDADAV